MSEEEEEDEKAPDPAMGSCVVVAHCVCAFFLTLLALGLLTALAFGLGNAFSQAYVPTVNAIAQATGANSQTSTTQAIPAPNPLVDQVP